MLQNDRAICPVMNEKLIDAYFTENDRKPNKCGYASFQ